MTILLAQALRTERIEQHVELARWSAGNALLVGAGISALALYAIIWLYRREARGQVTRILRWTLVGCRAAVLVALGLIGVEPVLVNYVHRRLDACTIVLADSSASMSLADHYRVPADSKRFERMIPKQEGPLPTRAKLVEKILTSDNDQFLKRLADKNTVNLYTFSDATTLRGQLGSAQTRIATTQPGASAGVDTNVGATGPATNVGQAIRGAIDAAAGRPIAAVVLLTDGGFNQGESTQAIAGYLKQKGIPAYAVGIGDPAGPINASVTEVNAPRVAFKNDPFSVSVRVAAQGIGDQPITVELLEKTTGADAPNVVETRSIRPDGHISPLVFQRRVGKPGDVTYTARIPPLPFESVASDNQRDSLPPVRILDDRMRVLLVAGAPSYDYRYLARMLERDKSVDVSCWLQSADAKAVREGTTIITQLPGEPQDIFKYDAIILMDVDPAELEPTWSGILSSFVSDHGGGLLYAAGIKYTGKFLRSPNTSSLVEMLPVVPDPDAEIIINELGHYQMRSWPLVVPEQAADDPILRLADSSAENRSIWASLDGPYWHYPVRREKPVAQVLLRHSDPRMVGSFGPHILLATQFVGAGRTAYLGFNSTWRWRRGDEKYFNRFWTQLLRFLVEGKLLGGRSQCVIQTNKDQFENGESIVVTARALDEKFAPLLAPQLDLVVEPLSAAGQPVASEQPHSVPLLPMPGREGYYQGRFIGDRIGLTRLTLKIPGAASAATERKDSGIL